MIITMPEWFQLYLGRLTPAQKGDLGCWILQERNDNKTTTEIMAIIDPGTEKLVRAEDVHQTGCVCADCAGAALTSDND
jgi:hypothetical protein